MRVRLSACVFACAVFALSGAPDAPAASFDCAKAKTQTEHVICSTRALNDQDMRMVVMLEVLAQFDLMGGRAEQRDEQRAWLKTRNACGASVGCLADLYKRRVDALRAQITALANARR